MVRQHHAPAIPLPGQEFTIISILPDTRSVDACDGHPVAEDEPTLETLAGWVELWRRCCDNQHSGPKTAKGWLKRTLARGCLARALGTSAAFDRSM
jgi:hypothetical protein